MKCLKYVTQSAHKAGINRTWVWIDAEGAIVGRLASRIAMLLRGKHKPYYTPHIDCGEFVVVTNAEKVIFTGDKEKDKTFIRYTGYPGGQRQTTPAEMRAKHPTRLLEKAVKGMLPKNRLGRQLFSKLMLYTGPTHPHSAQQPKKINQY